MKLDIHDGGELETEPEFNLEALNKLLIEALKSPSTQATTVKIINLLGNTQNSREKLLSMGKDMVNQLLPLKIESATLKNFLALPLPLMHFILSKTGYDAKKLRIAMRLSQDTLQASMDPNSVATNLETYLIENDF